ncbi:MAG: nucleotidyl transferase AbiEii/AbiGii toxin family protein [Kiritimatiellae bacterium]|nr:nucleotidyl transferase AbiEii/AbiGii toxin family protein [Kiritimatiellia bacterium]
MKSLKEQIDSLISEGYSTDAARAKVVHDAVLWAMHKSGFKANSTIKGGVVMSSLTGDVRRATMDMDIDFIHYSLAEKSVERFVAKLAKAIPQLTLKMVGKPIELKHEDYRGKRIYLMVKDSSIMRAIRTKVDIGVHKREEIEQVEFAFDVSAENSPAELLANSPEQIFSEKLLSLLRHGALSNRPKDVFDMCYLVERLDRARLAGYIKALIYENKRCRVTNHETMMKMLQAIFSTRTFVGKLKNSRVNWLEISSDEVITAIVSFLETLN